MATPDDGRVVAGAHVLAVRVFYADTDASGFVYHARTLEFFERGRSGLLRAAGLVHRTGEGPMPVVWVVRRLTLDFARPGRLDDALTVTTRIVALGGARVAMAQTLARGAERLVGAEVEAALVTIEGRPRRLPGAFAAALAQAGLMPAGEG